MAFPDPPSEAAIEVFNLLAEKAKKARPSDRLLASVPTLDSTATRAELIVWADQVSASLFP